MEQRHRLLRILEELTMDELPKFAFYLPATIPRGKRDTVSRVDLAEVILQYYPVEALDVTAEVLNKMPRRDLVSMLQGERSGVGPWGERTEEEREVAAAAAPPKLVTQQQLMRLASKVGKNWKMIGILFLGMENSRLEQIEEENPKNIVMQVFRMLYDWKNREKDKATAGHLYNLLNQEGVELDPSTYAFLIE
ncbi:FAS-associated death domain protein-like [Python bivittatus]|uniref:FAS-associated death domain protein-like n=1 Tax=Python bivittatus TaxID=176946 RepID=A0A9F2MW50_PYTBI|nr:FAS-associated death domain protein-like [Python bivittatus]